MSSEIKERLKKLSTSLAIIIKENDPSGKYGRNGTSLARGVQTKVPYKMVTNEQVSLCEKAVTCRAEIEALLWYYENETEILERAEDFLKKHSHSAGI